MNSENSGKPSNSRTGVKTALLAALVFVAAYSIAWFIDTRRSKTNQVVAQESAGDRLDGTATGRSTPRRIISSERQGQRGPRGRADDDPLSDSANAGRELRATFESVLWTERREALLGCEAVLETDVSCWMRYPIQLQGLAVRVGSSEPLRCYGVVGEHRERVLMSGEDAAALFRCLQAATAPVSEFGVARSVADVLGDHAGHIDVNFQFTAPARDR